MPLQPPFRRQHTYFLNGLAEIQAGVASQVRATRPHNQRTFLENRQIAGIPAHWRLDLDNYVFDIHELLDDRWALEDLIENPFTREVFTKGALNCLFHHPNDSLRQKARQARASLAYETEEEEEDDEAFNVALMA